MKTYSNRQLLPDPRRNEPEHNPPNRNPHPKPRRRHPARKLLCISDFKHELHDPPAQRDLDAYIAQQEDRDEPGDAGVGKADQRFGHAVVSCGGCARVVMAEDGAGCCPEGCGRGEEFEGRH